MYLTYNLSRKPLVHQPSTTKRHISLFHPYPPDRLSKSIFTLTTNIQHVQIPLLHRIIKQARLSPHPIILVTC